MRTYLFYIVNVAGADVLAMPELFDFHTLRCACKSYQRHQGGLELCVEWRNIELSSIKIMRFPLISLCWLLFFSDCTWGFHNSKLWCSHWHHNGYRDGLYVLIFSCDQAALWMVQSVCLSVCLFSVRPSHLFSPCSHHRIIMEFSGVITNDKSDVHAKGQGQRSKVKVTEVTTQLNRFRTVTPAWIHIWWWNVAYSLMSLRRGALLFFKVIHQISRSHSSKNRLIWPRLGVSGL